MQEKANAVAPHAGAWIEISCLRSTYDLPMVAPHAGAWIEMALMGRLSTAPSSRPTRARGLKFYLICVRSDLFSRAPRGRVD